MNNRTRIILKRWVQASIILVIVLSLFLIPAQVLEVQADDVGLNSPPELALDQTSVTVLEGHPALNSGTTSDPDGDPLTISASIGSIIDHNDGTWSWSYTPEDGPGDSQSVAISADDGNGGITQASFDLFVHNAAPTAVLENNGPVYEGQPFTLALTNPTDPSSLDAHAGFVYAFDCGSGAGYSAFSTSNTTTCPTLYDGVRAVGGQIRDKDGGVSEYTASVMIQNAVPTLGPLVLPSNPVQAGTTIQFTAVFTDPPPYPLPPLPEPVPPCYPRCNVVYWDWGDGSTDTIDQATSPTTIAHTYLEAGVYTIALAITDIDGDTTTNTYDYVVVYDPSGGFVTGGGWNNSPAEAYVPDPSMAGKASFGFVAKYQKGANVPDGSTEFQFKAGDLNFKSSSYEWLVIAGAKAKFKGEGTINGTGYYGFMLTAVDGQINGDGTDRLRIKIWDKNNEDFVIYDNQRNASDDAEPTTAIGGGNIVVRKAK